MLPSDAPETKQADPGENMQTLTRLRPGCSKAVTFSPLLMPQTTVVTSVEQEARYRPQEEKQQQCTLYTWPARGEKDMPRSSRWRNRCGCFYPRSTSPVGRKKSRTSSHHLRGPGSSAEGTPSSRQPLGRPCQNYTQQSLRHKTRIWTRSLLINLITVTATDRHRR